MAHAWVKVDAHACLHLCVAVGERPQASVRLITLAVVKSVLLDRAPHLDQVLAVLPTLEIADVDRWLSRWIGRVRNAEVTVP